MLNSMQRGQISRYDECRLIFCYKALLEQLLHFLNSIHIRWLMGFSREFLFDPFQYFHT